jgi:hypothetical protein
VLVIEPGEEHSIDADAATPTVNRYFRADDTGSPRQYPPPDC